MIVAHPIYTLSHPDALAATARGVGAHGLPAAQALSWAALLVAIVAALALLAGRFVRAACVALLGVLAAGALLFYAPRWYVAGGAVDGDKLGIEFNVLLGIMLGAVLWTHWGAGVEARAAKGLEILRTGVGLVLLPHPMHPFVIWDVAGMRAFGEGMGKLGFPCGVPLVWTMVSVQVVCCVAIVARRGVVPACAGLMLILGMGTMIVHYPDWFMVGPDNNGMEFPLTYLACYASLVLAYFPRVAKASAMYPSGHHAGTGGDSPR